MPSSMHVLMHSNTCVWKHICISGVTWLKETHSCNCITPGR